MSEKHLKVPLLLFSGGLDSTAMLWEALKHSPVDLLICEGEFGPGKHECENKARAAILNKINQRAPYKVRHVWTAKVPHLGGSTDFNRFLVQPIGWILMGLQHLRPDLNSEVQVGYVIGDQALSLRTEMLQAWDALGAIYNQENIPLRFPLARTTKAGILESIPQDIRKLVWSCELPVKTEDGKYKPCRQCLPCLTHATAVKISNKRQSDLEKARKQAKDVVVTKEPPITQTPKERKRKK